jgi:rhodanese-related sulfurtransferase
MQRRTFLSVLTLFAFVACSTRDHGAVWARPSDFAATSQYASSIFSAILPERGLATANISTEEMEAAIQRSDVIVLDTRPPLEWAISHIPGALNVAPKRGTSVALYVSDVAEISRLVNGDKTRPLILYCNGPFCGKSKRLSDELLAAGYSNVRRYQLGAPVWRALGKVMVIEPEGIRYVRAGDQTAVFIDTRDSSDISASAVANARSIARSLVVRDKDVGEIRKAKDDGRLPMNDHNTRIVVFGRDKEQARVVAEAIAREAFHNVSFFEGSYAEFLQAIRE